MKSREKVPRNLFDSKEGEYMQTYFGHVMKSIQKCEADKCALNSHKSRVCFLAHQAFSIFIPLAVLEEVAVVGLEFCTCLDLSLF